MERRAMRPLCSAEFLCLCIALGDEDMQVADDAWRSLRKLSRDDAETILLDLDRRQAAGPAATAAELFLKDRIWA